MPFSSTIAPADAESLTIETITSTLAEMPQEQHFQYLCKMLTIISEADEQVFSAIEMCWMTLTQQNLWANHFPTLEAFKKAIGFEDIIASVLARAPVTAIWKDRYARTIKENWGSDLHNVVHSVLPATIGTSLYRLLATYLEMVNLETATVQLLAKISDRVERAKAQNRSGRTHGLRLLAVIVTQCVLEAQDERRKLIEATGKNQLFMGISY